MASKEPAVATMPLITMFDQAAVKLPSFLGNRAMEAWLLLGMAVWGYIIRLEVFVYPATNRPIVPNSVEITYSFCGVAYGCNLLLCALRWVYMTQSSSRSLQILACYISLLASSTYILLWLGITYVDIDMKSVLFLPSRWMLYCCSMPAIWWILAHISSYSTPRKLYVLYLNWVMLAAGGIATIPCLTWGHKVYWMVLSCVPFPELCFHLWRMISDAIESCPKNGESSTASLRFIRIYGQFCYQFFPAIYFAAFDGCLPLAISEPLWSICDWCLKMAMTSSLMEADFFTISQRHEYFMALVEQARSFETIKELTLTMERKNRFLSAMSHELRTPLNGIIGMADAVSMMGTKKVNSTIIDTVEIIKLSSKRLLQLINDILDAAQLQNGNLILKHEVINLLDIVDNVIELILPQVQDGVDVQMRIFPVPHISGDGGRLTQVLFNLVSNACKFTNKGYIRIGVGYDEGTDMVFVYVSDTGCGIHTKDVLKVFGVFEQADMNITRHHGGTGLGLHFVKELVKAHWGKIDVRSKPGVGTMFVVRLPVQQEEVDVKPSHDPLDLNNIEDLTEPTGKGEPQQTKIPIDRHKTVKAKQLLRVQPALPSALAGSIKTLESSRSQGFDEEALVLHTTADTLGFHNLQLSANANNLATTAVSSNGTRNRPGGTLHLGEDVKHMKPAQSDAAEAPQLSLLSRRMFHSQVYGGYLVLSVDDDPVNQIVISNLLQPLGYKILQAMNGRDALSILKQCTALPDVILLDCMMPGMSGYSVCRSVRGMYGARIPIIMVSANSAQKQVIMGLEQGANDYIKKPFHRDELTVRITALLRANRLCDTELEVRMPAALIHLPVLPVFKNALAAGAEECSQTLQDTAVLLLSLQALVQHGSGGDGFAALDKPVLSTLFNRMPPLCERFRVALCSSWTSVLLFTTLPDEVPESNRTRTMVDFAEQALLLVAELNREYDVNLLPTSAITYGCIRVTCLNSLTSLRVLALGAPVVLGRQLSDVMPYGRIWIAADDTRAEEAFDPAWLGQASSLTACSKQVDLGSSRTDLWELSPKPATELCRCLIDTAALRNGGSMQLPGSRGESGLNVQDFLCAVMTDQQTLRKIWESTKDQDPDPPTTVAAFTELTEAIVEYMRTLPDPNEYMDVSKAFLTFDDESAGTASNSSATSNLASSNVETVPGTEQPSAGAQGRRSTSLSGAPDAIEEKADAELSISRDMQMLGDVVGMPHQVAMLQARGISVPQLAAMTEKDLSVLLRDALTMRERIHLLIAARKLLATTAT